MPQVVAAAVAYLIPATAATAVTIGATAISYATLIGYASTIGASIAYGNSQAAKMRNALSSVSSDQGRNVMARDPLASRRGIYGQVPVTGPVLFMHTTGTKNEYLHVIVGMAGHECEELGEIKFPNDEVVPLDGSGNATGKYAGYVTIKKHLGSTSQTYDTDLAAAAPGLWTSAHRLRGIAYLYIQFKYSADLFPNGMPVVKCMVKGKKVYDPRTTLTAWSDNSALCTADYLVDRTFGRGIPTSRILWSEVSAEANICDETVVLADASTEKRFTCNGTFNADQDALQDIVGSMAGRVIDTGGIWSVVAGAYRSVTAPTFTDDDLIGSFSVQTRASMRETFNGVKGTYFAPENQWTPSDFPAVTGKLAATALAAGDKVTILIPGTTTFTSIGAADNNVGTTFTATGAGTGTGYVDPYQGQDNGNRRWKDIALPFTISPSMAQRISKIDLKRGRQQIVITALYKLKAFQLRCCDTIKITRDVLGWTDKQFEVTDWSLQIMGEGDNLCLGILITAKETASAVYDWNNGEETVVDDAPNTTLPDPGVVPTAATPTLLTDTTTVFVHPDGTISPRLKVTITTPNNIFVESGGFNEIEYKNHSDSTWLIWNTIRGDALVDYITDVKVGEQYDVRVRHRNQIGVRGSYSPTATSSAVVGDTVAPNAPGTLSGSAKPGYNELVWGPSTSNTVNEYIVFRSTTSGVAGFSQLANTSLTQYDDGSVTAGVSYWYKVQATSRSELQSVDSNVVGAIVAALPAVGATTPSAPTAPTTNTSGTYDASDGTVFASWTLNIAALPANAIYQNVLFRKSGSTEWLIGAQLKNASGTTSRLDDLSPGVAYESAIQAFSAAGGSSIVTGATITAPTKSSGPPAYTGTSLVHYEKAPIQIASGVARYSVLFMWAEEMGDTYAYPKDFAYWEVKGTATNSDSATDYNVDNGSGAAGIYRIPKPSIGLFSTTPVTSHFRVRAVNTSGQPASAWYVNSGNSVNQRPGGSVQGKDVGTTSGTVAAGDDSRITGAAQKSANLSDVASPSTALGNLGGAAKASNLSDLANVATARKNLKVWKETYVPTALTGGSPTETVNIDITAAGCASAPVVVLIQCVSDNSLFAVHDYNSGSNTATNLVVTVGSRDGSAMGAGLRRYSVMLLIP